MPSFELEHRYLVVKRSDLANLEDEIGRVLPEVTTMHNVHKMVDTYRVSKGKQPLECLVVESDWPEYPYVLELIKARVEGHGDPAMAVAKKWFDRVTELEQELATLKGSPVGDRGGSGYERQVLGQNNEGDTVTI